MENWSEYRSGAKGMEGGCLVIIGKVDPDMGELVWVQKYGRGHLGMEELVWGWENWSGMGDLGQR